MNFEAVITVMAEHADCVLNDTQELGSAATGLDVWSCGIALSFVDDLEAAERAHLAMAVAGFVEGDVDPRHAVVSQLDVRIERLEHVAERWDVPGGSRRLAQRARDKVAGLEIARRLTVGDSR